MSKKFKVTLVVTQYDDQDHPGDWYWHDLLDTDVELVAVEPVADEPKANN